MFDDLSTTFYNNLVATYDDYAAERDSPRAGRDKHLRSAVNIAVALYHFREHLPPTLATIARNQLAMSADFALMRGVANAIKHRSPTANSPLVARADDVHEVTVIVRYSDEFGEYPHGQTVIEVNCTDGTKRRLDPSITAVLNFWGKLLADARICEFSPRAAPVAPGERFIPREEAHTKVDFEILQGLRFKQSMQLLRYDNATGQAVPIDLTGSEVAFRIFRPPQQTVAITMSHPEHGDFTADLPFSDEENLEFYGTETEEAREQFVRDLIEQRRPEIEQMLSVQLGSRKEK